MTGAELQSRIVRDVEAHYDRTVTAHRTAGMDAGEAHERVVNVAIRGAIAMKERVGVADHLACRFTYEPRTFRQHARNP